MSDTNTELTINANRLAEFEGGITWFVVHSKNLTADLVNAYLNGALVFQAYEPYPVYLVALPVRSNFAEPDYVIGKLGSGLHLATHHATYGEALQAATDVITERYLSYL